MRQQRTSQRRRVFDASQIPQYPRLEWTAILEGGHIVRLYIDGGVDKCSLHGVVPLVAMSIGQTPVSQQVVDDYIELTYAGYPLFDGRFAIAQDTDAVRNYHGGRLAVREDFTTVPLAPLMWTVTGWDGNQTVEVTINSGVMPYVESGILPFVSSVTIWSVAVQTIVGNVVTLEFAGPLVGGETIDLAANSNAVTDANGQPFGAGSGPV
jgi:fermentation-respiration switch protein FrsA (DUF1100 family)